MVLLRRLVAALRVRLGSFAAVARARRSSRARLARIRARRILVVCYGNIYRSAFVGELLRARLAPSIEIRSAGFHAVAGRSSPERHIQICGRLGVSLEQHRSSVITRDDLSWADLIVLMDRHNWAALRRLGAQEDKLVWLGSLLPGQVEIPDPYTLSDAHAELVVERMRDAAELLITSIEDRHR